RRLDEPDANPLGQLELVAGPVREGVARLLEVGDAESHVLDRAPLARPIGVEQRQLPAPSVRADERERVLPVDDMHAEMAGRKLDDRFAVRDPEGYVVERLRTHSASVAVRARAT